MTELRISQFCHLWRNTWATISLTPYSGDNRTPVSWYGATETVQKHILPITTNQTTNKPDQPSRFNSILQKIEEHVKHYHAETKIKVGNVQYSTGQSFSNKYKEKKKKTKGTSSPLRDISIKCHVGRDLMRTPIQTTQL